MNDKVLNALLNMARIGLDAAGVILILISFFTERDVLKWGTLCVALGSILALIWQMRNKGAR